MVHGEVYGFSNVHVAFIMHVAGYNMQRRIALHMHGDIALNEYECMVIINNAFDI